MILKKAAFTNIIYNVQYKSQILTNSTQVIDNMYSSITFPPFLSKEASVQPALFVILSHSSSLSQVILHECFQQLGLGERLDDDRVGAALDEVDSLLSRCVPRDRDDAAAEAEVATHDVHCGGTLARQEQRERLNIITLLLRDKFIT